MLIVAFLLFLFWLFICNVVFEWLFEFFDGRFIGIVMFIGFVLSPFIMLLQLLAWSK